jgi:hypothetical protein
MKIIFDDEDEKAITGLSEMYINLNTFQYINEMQDIVPQGKKMVCTLHVNGQDMKVING